MTLKVAPDPTNVSLGKGKLFLLPRATDASDTGFFAVGNADKLSTQATVTTIQNKNSLDHNAGIYVEIPVSTVVEILIEGFELTPDNVAAASFGTASEFTQSAGTATGVEFAAASSVVLGRYYEIGVRNPVITSIKQGATVLVEGTDYVVISAATGMIHLLDTGGATAGQALTWDGTIPAIVAADGFRQVAVAAVQKIAAKLRFLSDPQYGPHMDLTLWNVNLVPNGPIDFISDQEAKVSLKGTAQIDLAGTFGGSAAQPYGSVVMF